MGSQRQVTASLLDVILKDLTAPLAYQLSPSSLNPHLYPREGQGDLQGQSQQLWRAFSTSAWVMAASSPCTGGAARVGCGGSGWMRVAGGAQRF